MMTLVGQIWEHDDQQYDYESYYDLDADAWVHEVYSLGEGGAAWIVIPDATPDESSFTPLFDRAVFKSAEGTLPLPIIDRLLDAAKKAGDIK
jgi:hypothetical protein